MPISDTLKTAEELRVAGFPENQAAVLAEKFGETAHAIAEDLKTFISAELDRKLGTLRGKMPAMEARLDLKIADLRTELHSSLRDQTVKLMAILIAAISLAVAIIKVFPNAH